MACSIQLVRLNDFAADIDSIDLSADGYSLDQDGYFPVVAPIGARSVHEVITLKLQGTSKDDLAAMTQEIDEKIKQVQWWMDDPGVERYQVWLRVQQENESLPRQAQLLNIIPPDKLRVFVPEEINNNYIGAYSLGIERTPFWEDPYPYPTTTAKNGLDILGGMVQLSETINGDVPARLVRLNAVPLSNLTNVWLGWKTSRFGTASGFQPVWELYNGAPIDADTSETADATAYGGTKVTTSFTASALLILRDQILLSQIASAHSVTAANQRGSYMVLLRAKMSDSSVARVQMVYGLYSSGAFQSAVYRSRAVISGTAWSLFDLGSAKIPPLRLPLTYALDNFSFGLYAERISGAGALDMDCLILIPYDDGAIKATSSGSVTSTQALEVFQAADDSLYATGKKISTNESIYSVIPYPQGPYGVPANNEAPYIVVATSDSSVGAIKGKTVDITYEYIPRWRTLRGNVT